MLRRDRRVVPFGVVAHDGVDVLRRVHRRHARRPVRGVEIVAAEHDHRHAVAIRVVDIHGGVHQPDRAVDQRHQRLVGDLVIAVGDADAAFLMGAGEEFRHRVLAVVDQRLVDGAIARCRIGRQVFDVERLDDVDHEVRSGPALARIGRNIRHAGLGGGDMGVRRQRRWQPLLRFRRGRGFGGADGTAGAGNGGRGEEFSAVELHACILFGHLVSPWHRAWSVAPCAHGGEAIAFETTIAARARYCTGHTGGMRPAPAGAASSASAQHRHGRAVETDS